MQTVKEPKPRTVRQIALLETLVGFWREHGYSPTIRQLADLGPYYGFQSVLNALDNLQEEGAIRLVRGEVERTGRDTLKAIVPTGVCACCGRAE
jgi:SOS-response transcriptional repressor LexA